MASEIIIVDDFYSKPEAVRARALASDYANIDPTDYPGYASRLRLDSASLEKSFSELIGCGMHVDPARFTWGGFRYITEDSGRKPRVHADVAVDWAGMVYLTPDAPMRTGTAFYRHQASGRSSPPTDREARAMGFSDAAEFDERVIRRDKADLTAWEEITRVGSVFNRLVLFRGGDFYHAPMAGCGDSPESARLTHVFFFNEKPGPGTAVHRVGAAANTLRAR